jgi:hypothetical protein
VHQSQTQVLGRRLATGVDTQTGTVHPNGSGIKTGRDERVSMTTFEKAWATSQNLAVVTG